MSVDWQQHDQSEHGLFILDIIINAQNVLWMMVVMMCVNALTKIFFCLQDGFQDDVCNALTEILFCL